MDSQIYNIFTSQELEKIKTKLSKLLLNSDTNVKSKYTRFELFNYDKNKVVDNELISVYDIFIDESNWNNLMSKFIHLEKKTSDYTLFKYKNMILNKLDDGKSSSEKLITYKKTIGPDSLYILSEVHNVDVSEFSCRDDLESREIFEHKILLSEKAPIYISFIHDKKINKFYYKLWFEIKEDIDDVLDSLLA